MRMLTREALTQQEQEALASAKAVSRRAHAPYSGFVVGATFVTEGDMFSGCNVENASYGLTTCAERNGVAAAIAGGAKFFLLLAIYTPTKEPTTPCGACRQVLREFAPSLRILMACDGEDVGVATLEELLPASFGFSGPDARDE